MNSKLSATIELLLIEDDLQLAMILTQLLATRDVEVTHFESAEEALEIFNPDNYDILVSDIMLKGMSGVDLLERIKKENPQFPVILLTGYESQETAIQAVRHGAQDYILKPLSNIDDLYLPVQKAVRNARLIAYNALLEKDRLVSYKKLEKSHRDLKRLSLKLVKVEDEQKRKLGQDLHDQAGQILSVLGVSLGVVRKNLSAESKSSMVERIDDAMKMVEQLGRSIRRVMSELDPVILYDYGLYSALSWYCNQFSKRTSIPVEINGLDFKSRPEPSVELALFRICVEALVNIAKHAKATKVNVLIESKKDTVKLEVQDNGIGMSNQIRRLRSKKSAWGLMLMRERADVLGGKFRIKSAKGKGTTIVTEIPSRLDLS